MASALTGSIPTIRDRPLTEVRSRVSDRPPISITISTGQGWPAIAAVVRSAEAAAAVVGGEVVVTDGSGLPAPWPAMLGLYLVQAAGQMVGFVAGPGNSPNRVQ